METKRRRVTESDWDKVEKHVLDLYNDRKDSTFRKDSERIWKEVDRQIEMSPMEKRDAQGKPIKTWHHAIELGELSKASEIIASDVMRIMFPADRAWFQPHVELTWPLDPQTGRKQIQPGKQKVADGLLRNLMAQQHKDFGFKDRFRLSVKEALHHGSFVAEVRFAREIMVRDGDKVRSLGAPVWVPYSMWNCFPDPSPSVIGAGMFYTGSMIMVEYIPKAKLKELARQPDWKSDRLKDVPEEENETFEGNRTKDVKLIKYYGDLVIERSGEDIYLPNAKVILANGKLVYYAPNEMPYPSVVFSGYEQQDVRNPYHTSPIIKLSPTQKMATIVANKFLDAIALKVEPPVEYDGNDPDYVMNDGPEIAPGAKTPTKAMGQGFKTLDIGDPRFALQGLELALRQLQEGLGVSSLRSGVQVSDRQTATEATLQNQGAEVRTMEFITKLNDALLPFLYMQHDLNRQFMEDYTFYSDELRTEDVIRVRNSDIQADAMFDVVGAKGVLGEQERAQRTSNVVAFASGSPLFASSLKPTDILLDMLRDAGKRNPEDWVQVQEASPQMQQMQAQMQQAQQQLQAAQQQIAQKEQQLQQVEQQLTKKANDAALKEQKVRYEEQLLTLKKQADAFQEQERSAREAMSERALGETAQIMEKADGTTQALAAVMQQMADSVAQSVQAVAAVSQKQDQSTSVQIAILDALTKPKKIDISRNTAGQIVGATSETMQ